MFHSISGVLVYHSPEKVSLEFGSFDLSAYYRSLIPKYCYVQGPRYKDHISVVRKEKIKQNAGFAAGRRFSVNYDTDVKTDRHGRYWWLDCWSDDLCELRVKLGLPPFRYRAANVLGDRFHITIGNRKGVLEKD